MTLPSTNKPQIIGEKPKTSPSPNSLRLFSDASKEYESIRREMEKIISKFEALRNTPERIARREAIVKAAEEAKKRYNSN